MLQIAHLSDINKAMSMDTNCLSHLKAKITLIFLFSRIKLDLYYSQLISHVEHHNISHGN